MVKDLFVSLKRFSNLKKIAAFFKPWLNCLCSFGKSWCQTRSQVTFLLKKVVFNVHAQFYCIGCYNNNSSRLKVVSAAPQCKEMEEYVDVFTFLCIFQTSLSNGGSILTPTVPLSSICHSGSNKSNKSLSSKSDPENNKTVGEVSHGVTNGHHNDKGNNLHTQLTPNVSGS